MASATIFFASRSAFRFAALANLADLVGGVGLRLFLHAPDQLVLGVLGRHARPSARAGAARRRRASRAPLAIGDRLLATAKLARPAAESLSRCSRSSNLRSSTFSRSATRRSSRSTSSRRPRTSPSKFSRSLISSSLPVTTALFRRFSASRSASPTIRFDDSSAVDFAATWRSISASAASSCVLQ